MCSLRNVTLQYLSHVSLQKRMEMLDRRHLVATTSLINALRSYTALRPPPSSIPHAQRLIRVPLPMESLVLMRPSLLFHRLPATPSTLPSVTILAIRDSVPTKGSMAAVAAVINNLCRSECIRFGWAHCFLVRCQNLGGRCRLGVDRVDQTGE